MPMPTLQQIIGTITGKVAFERTQANFTTIKDTHNVLDTDLTTHKAESANKHIKESGRNVNGTYIKFDDGTVICHHSISAIDVTGADGSSFRSNSMTWTLPVTLIDAVYISASIVGSSNSWGGFQGATTTTLLFRLNKATSITSITAYLVVLGRWK